MSLGGTRQLQVQGGSSPTASAVAEVGSRPVFNMIDLFSGVGGLTLGFSDTSDHPRFSFRARLMADADREARDVARRNMPSVPFVQKDISKMTAVEIREAAGMTTKEVLHLLVGGPPCQGFSTLGRRALEDERNALVLEFLRMVKELRPLAAVMENVPIMMTAHDGAVMREVSDSLSGMGYANIADILNASDYGVPQLRRRAFVIAYRGDLGLMPRMPVRTHEKLESGLGLIEQRRRVRIEEGKLPYVSVEDAIGDLPALGAGQGAALQLYANAPSTPFQLWARIGAIALFNHKARPHNADYLRKISVIVEGGSNADLPDDQRFSNNYFSSAYARLHRHGIAQTITTFFSNPGSGRFTHYRDLRAITVREAARLQSFQDWFVFDGTLTAQCRQIGNAVPPLLARAIRSVIGEDLISAGAHLEVKPVGRPKRVPRVETQEKRSRIMSAVPSKNTRPELLLRKALGAAGLKGYRLHRTDLPGSPDLVFPKQRLAVFVDGCFWHGCPKCHRAPKANAAFWAEKVARNRGRDARVVEELTLLGFQVKRLWEHEILEAPDDAVSKVEHLLSEVPAAHSGARTSRRQPNTGMSS